MLLNINTLEQLEAEAQIIDDYLNDPCSEDPHVCVSRGLELMVYLARTGKMLSDAKYHQDEAVKNSILNEIKMDVSASIMKKLIESTCKRENYLVTWIGRLNAAITHQMDFMRTVISRAKQEQYQNSRMG